jgi:hypothetical protein
MSKRSVAEWLDDIISWGERLEGHLAGMTEAHRIFRPYSACEPIQNHSMSPPVSNASAR